MPAACLLGEWETISAHARFAERLCLLLKETKKVRFILTWFFPNHFGEYHNRLGHYYENLFENAKDANLHLSRRRSDIEEKAEKFAELLYNTSLPQIYPDAWSAHLSTIVKCSWYIKDGKFGLWEGLGSLRIPHDRHHISRLVRTSRAVPGASEKADEDGTEIPARGRTCTPLLHTRP